MNQSCPECGFPLNGNESNCPECGFSLRKETVIVEEDTTPNKESAKTDWANYVYECGVIMWNVLRHNYANPYGRASRREFWSFTIITMCLMSCGLSIIMLIPWICVSIRRMHDINRRGWWSCVPFACFFMYLKKSDAGENEYGLPNPAKNMIY